MTGLAPERPDLAIARVLAGGLLKADRRFTLTVSAKELGLVLTGLKSLAGRIAVENSKRVAEFAANPARGLRLADEDVSAHERVLDLFDTLERVVAGGSAVSTVDRYAPAITEFLDGAMPSELPHLAFACPVCAETIPLPARAYGDPEAGPAQALVSLDIARLHARECPTGDVMQAALAVLGIPW